MYNIMEGEGSLNTYIALKTGGGYNGKR